VFSLLNANVYGQVDEATASEAVSKAGLNLSSAYAAVLDAENIGADVSGYLPRLNVAGEFLARAEICYRDGNYSGALHFADLASEGLAGLPGEVTELAESAAESRGQALYWTVAGSAFGVVVVVFAGFLSWGRVRAWHVQRVLRMKPEVSDAAEP
jgi:hypothetical protein